MNALFLMKNHILFLLIFIGFISFGKEKSLDQVECLVYAIDSDTTLIKLEYDWMELSEYTTDGGGVLKVWRDKEQIRKIVEEIGLSYGQVKTTIYLQDDLPIKIIETEENFGFQDGEINYTELFEVYSAEIYVYDWEMDDSEIVQKGKRNLSDGTCSMYEYESVIELAKKTMEN